MEAHHSSIASSSKADARDTPVTTSVICALIVLFVVALFGRTVQFDFINYDDPVYVYDNEVVSKGLHKDGLKWAATEVGETNLWHPLTWLSHMVDVEVFGVENPGGHHGVNVFWHAVSALGMFFLLRRLTSSSGIALFLALIWALHPQRVQSVVWISERKDVLSGAFFLWSWWCWEKWRGSPQSHLVWYLTALMLFIFAGLSKPSVVPLPLILYLRELMREGKGFSSSNIVRWSVRVLPFVLVSAAVASLTIYFQRTGSMADVTDVMPATRRAMLMPASLWWYIQTFIFPVPGQLWVYPPAGHWSDLIIPAAGLSVCAVAVSAMARADRLVPFGAGVFLFMWLPVSGVVPVSFYFVADRYSYLIQLGLLFSLAGGIRMVSRWSTRALDRNLMVATAAMVVLAAVMVSWARSSHWKDSETLFSHERRINSRSLLAPIHLGNVMEKQGKLELALSLYQEAWINDTESGLAATGIARVLEKLDKPEEAMAMYQTATESRILNSEAAFSHLARLRLQHGDLAGAEKILLRGLQKFPDRVQLLMDLGSLALSHQRNHSAALEWYGKALTIDPNHADAMQGKAVTLIEIGRLREGRDLLEELLRRHPDREEVRRFLQKSP